MISGRSDLTARLAIVERQTGAAQKVEALKSLHVVFNIAATDGEKGASKILELIESELTVDQRGEAMQRGRLI